MNFSSLWPLVKSSVSAWIDDYAPSMGAALAYYTVFSLAPLLLIVIAVAGVVFGQDAVRGEIVHQLAGLMGEESASAVQELLKSASSPKEGLVSSIVGVVLLIVGATTVFAELQSALDRIWRVPAPKKASGLWNLLRTRFLSFGMVLGLGFMMLVSLVVGAALSALGNWYGTVFRGWEVVLYCVNVLVSLAMSTTLFAMIYKFMPRARIAWSDVWIGAAVTAVLFEVGKFLIGALPRQGGRRFRFRRRRLARRADRLGLLLRADLPARCGVHLGLCARPRIAFGEYAPRERRSTTDAPDAALPTGKKSGEIPSRGADFR